MKYGYCFILHNKYENSCGKEKCLLQGVGNFGLGNFYSYCWWGRLIKDLIKKTVGILAVFPNGKH